VKPESHEERPSSARDLSDPAHLVVPLRIIAGLMIVGAVALTASIVVPFLLAIVLAIALEPLVERLVRMGVPNALASLAGMLLVAGVLVGVGGLITYQTGAILQDSDRYVQGFSRIASRVAQATGAQRLLDRMGTPSQEDSTDRSVQDQKTTESDSDPSNQPPTAEQRMIDLLRRNAERIGSYFVSALGGLIGVVGSLVLLLAFLFYMLLTRKEWMGRTTLAMSYLGMRPGRRELEVIQEQMVRYLGRLGLVSLSYVVIVSLGLWLIGLPQPILWGVLTGVLEIVPYVGPILAATLPTLVALGSGTLAQPAMVFGFFLVLQTIEGYVITPLLYGDAVQINPVTVLLGVLFFGWLLGPWGLMLAMPLLILLRGLLVLAPGTPALDVMLEADKQEAAIEAAAEEEAEASA
jgi:predicted PurR-regulated permease PerM